MRRAKLAVLLSTVTLVALVAPVTAARATTTDDQATPYTCYPDTSSAFTVTVGTVVNDQVTTTLADGTPIPGGFVAQSDPPFYPDVSSGLLVQTFTNGTTGKTIVRNVSGPSWFTYDPAPTVPGALATGTFVATGTTAQLFGPLSDTALEAVGIHEPTLIFESGLLVMHFVVAQSGAYVTSFSLNGRQQNGCALLSG
jgi:hypothetical protein